MQMNMYKEQGEAWSTVEVGAPSGPVPVGQKGPF